MIIENYIRKECMTKTWFGILIIVLIFGGCRENGPENNENLLPGTWLGTSRDYYIDAHNEVTDPILDWDYKITFSKGISEDSVYKGTFQESFRYIIQDEVGKYKTIENNLLCKGNYSVSGGNIIIDVTHVNGEYFGREGWYPIQNEDGIGLTLVKEIFSIEKFFYDLPLVLRQQGLPQLYTFLITTSLKMTTIVNGTTPYAIAYSFVKVAKID
jgi:hypothetical protein